MMSSFTRRSALALALAAGALLLGAREARAQPAGWSAVYRVTEPAGASQPRTWDIALGRDRAVVIVGGQPSAGVYVATVEPAGDELRLRYRAHFGAGAAAVAGSAPMLRLVRGAQGAVEARFEAIAPHAARRALPAAVASAREVTAPVSASGHDDLLTLAAALGDCGPMEMREGGNRIVCASGLALQVGSVAAARVAVRPEAPGAVPVRCTDYLARSGFSSVDVTAAVTLCDPTTGPVTASSDVDAIARSYRGRCQRQSLRGGTHLTCEGRTFSFAGPRLALQRVAASAPAR